MTLLSILFLGGLRTENAWLCVVRMRKWGSCYAEIFASLALPPPSGSRLARNALLAVRKRAKLG